MRDNSALITGRITNGQIDVTLDAIRAAVQGWPDGLVTVAVRFGGKKHSDRQRRTWFGLVVEPLAEHLGYDHHEADQKAAVHYALVSKCYGETWDERLKCFIPNKRSSDLSMKDYADMTDWAVRYVAQEHGLVLTLPSERDA